MIIDETAKNDGIKLNNVLEKIVEKIISNPGLQVPHYNVVTLEEMSAKDLVRNADEITRTTSR